MRLGYKIGTATPVEIWSGFNEAEAHAPRIHIWRRPVASGAGVASMRPRRMRLGYQRGYDQTRHAATSFNEAEAHAPRIQPRRWNTRFAMSPLQ